MEVSLMEKQKFALNPNNGQILGTCVIDESSYPEGTLFIEAEPIQGLFKPIWDITNSKWVEGATADEMKAAQTTAQPKPTADQTAMAQLTKQVAALTATNAEILKQIAASKIQGGTK